PAGFPGEIYVGGAGVSQGYLNRPELTAERFVPNPFSLEPGARLYRSGDLARYAADGDLEYLGRADDQVKIRGFRIELGEIEAALAQHEAVRQAVVLVSGDNTDEKSLVACIVTRDGATAVGVQLREYLTKRLPPYMVPAHYVRVDEIPLTDNGKIDRRL